MTSFNDNIISITSYLPWGKKCNCAGIYRFWTIILTLGIIYSAWFYFLNDKYDYLNVNLFEIPGCGYYGGWALSHFISYFILGLLFPDCDLLIIVTSIIWEVFEEIIFHTCKFSIKNSGQYGDDRWGSGKVSDIFFNLAGFYLGKFIVKIFNLDIKIPYINDEKVYLKSNHKNIIN